MHPDLDIRLLDASDRRALAVAFDRLSAESRHQRFLSPKPRLTAAELDRLTRLDHLADDAIAAFERSTGRLVAVARYAASFDDEDSAEIAFFVADDWQGRGLGSALARQIVWRAATAGFARMSATVLADNERSLALLRRLGFRLAGREAGVLELTLVLDGARQGAQGQVATV